MLRGLLLALLLANLAFFVWSQGGFSVAGGQAAGEQREPERLSRQWHPDAVQLIGAAGSAAAASAAASAPPQAASEAASSAATTDTSASAAAEASAASSASAPPAGAALADAAPSAVTPGTRCLEAGPFGKSEWASVESALANNAKTRRMARRWVQDKPDAASASAAPQRRLRIDATPDEVAVLEALPASLVGRSFGPCTTR